MVDAPEPLAVGQQAAGQARVALLLVLSAVLWAAPTAATQGQGISNLNYIRYLPVASGRVLARRRRCAPAEAPPLRCGTGGGGTGGPGRSILNLHYHPQEPHCHRAISFWWSPMA